MTSRRIVYQFGVPSTLLLVFGEQFTGNGIQTQFQLAGTVLNATFSTGEWNADQVKTTLPVEVTGTDYKPTYDSIIPFTRHVVAATGVSGTGLVTLDYPPRNGVNFYIWYWYDLESEDLVDEYWRNDFVASMEQSSGAHGSTSLYDTDSSNVLSLYWNENDTVDRSLDIYVGGADRTLCLAPAGLRAFDSIGFKIWADDGTSLGLHIDDSGRVGLSCLWDNTFGNDLTTARIYSTQTITSAWGSTRTGLVRLVDCLRLPAGTYGANYNTFQLHGQVSVATGVTVARTLYLAQYYQLRNFDLASTDDSGTLSALIGFQFSYGHFNANNTATPVTTTSYGINMTPYMQAGTVTTFYDFRIATPNITGGRTPVINTAHYPISQEAGDDAITAGKTRNYFNARTGFKTTDPQGVVEIEDGATTYSQLLKITQDDANVYGLIIGNDTYSTTDTLGMSFHLSDAGSGVIQNLAALDLYIRSAGTANTSNLYFQVEDKIYFYDYNAASPALRGQWNMQTGDMCVGGAPTANNKLTVSQTLTSVSGIGLQAYSNAEITSNGTYYTRGLQAVCYVNVNGDKTATNTSGYHRAVEGLVFVRENSGTIGTVTGIYTEAGSYGPAGADVATTITTLHGLRVSLFTMASTTVTTVYGCMLTFANLAGTHSGTTYGLYIGPLTAGASKFAIYQEGTADKVYFGSITGVGIGSGCTSPVASLEIEDGGSALTYLLKLTQDDENVYGLAIGNDTYSTTDANSFLLWLSNTGVANMSSPVGVITAPTMAFTNLTNGYVPYHVSDASGLANSPIWTDGTSVGIGTAAPSAALSFGTYLYDSGKKLALYEGAGGTSLYGFGVEAARIRLYVSGTHSCTWTNTGHLGIGVTTTEPTGLLSFGTELFSTGGSLALYEGAGGANLYGFTVTASTIHFFVNAVDVVDFVSTDNGRMGIAVVAPVARLEIEDAGTSAGMLLKLTQDDENVYGLVIGNDTYSTTDTSSLLLWLDNSGCGNITSPTNLLLMKTGGNVGIGTITFPASMSKGLAFANSGVSPSAVLANGVALWCKDIAAGNASLYMMSESGTGELIVAGVLTKTDTGDPAQVHEGLMCINTYDNVAKLYADGAWRTLATW